MIRIALLFVAAVLIGPGALGAQGLSGTLSTASKEGPVIEFTDAEFVLADGLVAPATGWQRAPNPRIIRMRDTNW